MITNAPSWNDADLMVGEAYIQCKSMMRKLPYNYLDMTPSRSHPCIVLMLDVQPPGGATALTVGEGSCVGS